MSVHQIKCYLLRKADSNSVKDPVEIKRFTLSWLVESFAYESLINQILSHFREIKNAINTYWLDDEKELVKFSTNEEFLNFISIDKDKVLKIYIHKEAVETPDVNLPDIFGEISKIFQNSKLMSTIGNIFEKLNISKDNQSQFFKPSDEEIEERVKVSVEQLKLMGYSNDNNCLAKLLRENHGNINPVLDIISHFYF